MEIENQYHQIAFREMALKKREVVLLKQIEENKKLKLQIKKLNDQISGLERQTKEITRENAKINQNLIDSNNAMFEIEGLTSQQKKEYAERELTLLYENSEFDYFNSEKYKFIHTFLNQSQKPFMQKLCEIPPEKQNRLFHYFQEFEFDIHYTISKITKFKQFAKSLHSVLSSQTLSETLRTLGIQISNILECERTQIYILDNKKKIFQIIFDGQVFTAEVDKGVPAYVVQNQLNARVNDIKTDKRYAPFFEEKHHLKTKSILAVPIKDCQGIITGVIEASNKMSSRFTLDDEALLMLISLSINDIISNSYHQEKTRGNQFNLVKIIQMGNSLFECMNLEILLPLIEQRLREFFHVSTAYVYAYDKQNEELVRSNEKALKKFKSNLGIIGEALNQKNFLYMMDPQSSTIFNRIVDIETHLPIVTMPIMRNQNEIIGIFQVIFIKSGFQQLMQGVDSYELELLQLLSIILGTCIDKSLKIETIINDQIQTKLNDLQINAQRLHKYLIKECTKPKPDDPNLYYSEQKEFIQMRNSDGIQEFEQLVQACRDKEKQFLDDQFPPQPISLSITKTKKHYSSDGNLLNILWKRPVEYYGQSNFSLFDEVISAMDISEGLLRDSYLLAAIAAFIEFDQEKIKELFLSQEISEFGIYALQFFDFGQKATVCIDDHLPCYEESGPLYSFAEGNQMWVSLLEKAWAKLFTNYENIEFGVAREALHAFTGAPTEYFFNRNNVLNDEQTWKLLKYACENKFFITTTTDDFPEKKIKEGIVELKYFTVVNCFEIDQFRLLQLRNLNTNAQWNGNWRESSHYWTEELKQKCNQEEVLKNGQFFVDLKEFRQRFSFFEVCYNHDGFVYYSLNARQNYLHHACFFEITINKFGLYYISVEQKNIRHQSKFTRQKYSIIQLLIAKKTGTDSYQLIDQKKNDDREFWIKSELSPGQYIVYIRPYWYDNDIKRDFLLSCFAEHEVKIAQIQRVKNFLQDLFLCAQKKFIEKSYFHDMKYQLIQDKSKGIGYYWVKNYSSKRAISVKTEFRMNKAYKFKKPVKNGIYIMKIDPLGEDVAIFTMKNLDYEELKIESQEIAYVD